MPTFDPIYCSVKSIYINLALEEWNEAIVLPKLRRFLGKKKYTMQSRNHSLKSTYIPDRPSDA